ncbi:hypothetical protein [Verminephrobacter aporrectodeae]|uniref:hypothetical protein n=1 Tax=Verminephrobacter aporrectodeae TaxID=1110389 RepID=UPI0022380DF3|nr:hypothetical protein [Verminephrobacter aporrectodeae]
MPSPVDIKFVMPVVLKIGSEGVICVQPIPGVDQTKAKIDELTLTVLDGQTHVVTDYQKDFASADWTFSFFVPQSFISETGPSITAIVNFKVLDGGQVFQTMDDYIICVDIELNKPPFSVTAITPTSVKLDAQSTAQLSVTGTALDKAFSNCNLAGPSPISATVTGASATNCTVVIQGSDVSVLGKYRILLSDATTQDTFIAPIFINIEGKAPLPNLTLLSSAPDTLSPGDIFTLKISKDEATSSWDDVRIGDIRINTASGCTMGAAPHGSIKRISNTEGSLGCTLDPVPRVRVKEKATLKLSATYEGKPINVTNTFPLTIQPDPHARIFKITCCAPFTVPKDRVKTGSFRFRFLGTNLYQITSIKFANSYQMGIISQTAYGFQCRFLPPPTDIQAGRYQFTVKYIDPQSGTEQSQTVQNITVEITS